MYEVFCPSLGDGWLLDLQKRKGCWNYNAHPSLVALNDENDSQQILSDKETGPLGPESFWMVYVFKLRR